MSEQQSGTVIIKKQHFIRYYIKPDNLNNSVLKARLKSHGFIQGAMNPVMTHALFLAVLCYYGDGC